MFDTEKTTLLEHPLDMTQIKHRQGGGGKQLAYISGKFAMDQANRIFGYGQWGYKVVSRGHMVVDDPKNGKIEMYTADVELSVIGAAFTFPGAGVGIVGKPYTVDMHEKAYKEAETDAMKRALRHYGDQFGLVLYDGDDYVDAGNGEMIQVKDVPVQHQGVKRPTAPSKPVAVAPLPGTSPVSTTRLNSLYARGKALGNLFNNVGEFAAFCQLALVSDSPIVPKDMTIDQARDVEDAIAARERQALEQAS